MLIFKRPIIYIDYKGKIHNKESENITIKTIDEEFKNIFGNVLNISKIKNLPALCESLINDNTVSNEKVSLFFEKYLSNLNESANFASNYLINKSKDN